MTKDQRLIAILTLVAVLSAAFVGTRLATGDGLPAPVQAVVAPPVPAITRNVPVGADGKLSLVWVGDTLLGDEAQPLIDQQGYNWPLQGVRPLLKGDFVLANSESPITPLTQPWNISKQYSYQMRPAAAAALAAAGIDAISLANNHSMDRGPTGLIHTLMNARAAKLVAIGGGENIDRAQQPLILKSPAGTVGVVAFGEDFGRDSRATRSRAGATVLDVEAIEQGIAQARAAGAESVVAFVHWGDNYVGINGQQRYWAQQFARAGYTMVVGSGSHVAQPVGVIDGMPVVYSLGNFVFGAPGRFAKFKQPGVGLVVTTELKTGQGVALTLRCISTDNSVVRFQPRPCSPELAQAVIPTLYPKMTMRGEVGVLKFSPRRQAR
jgi:hypothetical protein